MKKKYLNISDVSKLLGLKEHVIRYWDSIDPKTNKLRIDGISTKSKRGTRYFNRENINKLEKLKNVLYEGNEHNHSLKLANKLLSSNNLSRNNSINDTNHPNYEIIKNNKKIEQILKNMRILLK